MYKTVEKAIRRIARKVERETGSNILDYLYDAVGVYEYDEDGRKATARWIINGLENEADNFIDAYHEGK